MHKLKQITRYIVPFFSYLFLTGLFFAAGYSIGTHTSGGIMTTNTGITATEHPIPSPTPAAIEAIKHYRVILEDSQLRLYLDENDKSRLISNDMISETTYPTDDIAVLKEGVDFDILSDALAFMENFLS